MILLHLMLYCCTLKPLTSHRLRLSTDARPQYVPSTGMPMETSVWLSEMALFWTYLHKGGGLITHLHQILVSHTYIP